MSTRTTGIATVIPKKRSPDVSIIVTVYNGSLYLQAAVASVFGQRTSATWELLIVDDGSTDGSFEIARDLARQFPQAVSLLHHPGRANRGISASRNLALRHARAPVTAFLDADDVWLEHRLESQLPLLAANPEVAMVYAQAERWYDFDRPYSSAGSSGRNFVPPLLPPGERSGLIRPPELLTWFLKDESLTPCTCTVLVRTAIARRWNGFVNLFTGLYDDQVFYAKLALHEKILVNDTCVARYRQHPASCCAVARSSSSDKTTREAFLGWLETYLSGPGFAGSHPFPERESLIGISETSALQADASELPSPIDSATPIAPEITSSPGGQTGARATILP